MGQSNKTTVSIETKSFSETSTPVYQITRRHNPEDWDLRKHRCDSLKCPIPLFWLQAEPALMYDSVYVFAQGLATLDRGHVLKPANLSCELEQPWNDGLSLYNYINSVSICPTSHLPYAEHKRVGINTMSVIGSEIQPRSNYGRREFVGTNR